MEKKRFLHTSIFTFEWTFIKLAGKEDRHKISDKFKFWPDRTVSVHYGVLLPLSPEFFLHRLIKCLHASTLVIDLIFGKLAGNQERHKISDECAFQPALTSHFGVTCPWGPQNSPYTYIFKHAYLLSPVGQSWSNFIRSINRVGERLN